MVLTRLRSALEWSELPDRYSGPGQIRVQVSACGVCRTDLHVVDGELPAPRVPIIPGHEIVGRIDAIGAGVEGLRLGTARRHSLARPHLRGVSVLPQRIRESLR
jgi:propanol-preferring alcohol dehydrogenase